MTSEYLILFVIILLLLFVFYIKARFKKNIESEIKNRIIEIESDKYFNSKLEEIKTSIDISYKNDFESKIADQELYYINDSIKRSGSVSKGKVLEHFTPYLLSEESNPNEMIFIGSPIDFIWFKNIDGSNSELSVEFLEIKTGNSKLTTRQKLIRDAIKNKRVHFKSIILE